MAFFQSRSWRLRLCPRPAADRAVRTQALVHCAALMSRRRPAAAGQWLSAPRPTIRPCGCWGVGAVDRAPFASCRPPRPWCRPGTPVQWAIDGREPYALYAASNLGNLLALLAYPCRRAADHAGQPRLAGAMPPLLLGDPRGRGRPAPAAPSSRAARPVSWRIAVWIGWRRSSSLMLASPPTSRPTWPLRPSCGSAAGALPGPSSSRSGQAPDPDGSGLSGAGVAACGAALPHRVFALLFLHLTAFFFIALMCRRACGPAAGTGAPHRVLPLPFGRGCCGRRLQRLPRAGDLQQRLGIRSCSRSRAWRGLGVWRPPSGSGPPSWWDWRQPVAEHFAGPPTQARRGRSTSRDLR